jgi:alpha-mannosidase
MPLKLAILRLENKLLYQVEPLFVVGQTCGINLSNNLLIEAWKKVLESQAHDSLAGSINDEVAEDIQHRIKEGNELADGIINTIQRLLALKLHLKSNQVLLINPALKENEGYHKIKVFTSDQYVEFENTDETVLLKQKYIKSRSDILLQSSDGNHYVTEPGYFCSEYLIKKILPPLSYQILNFHEAKQVDKLSITNTSSNNITLKFEDETVSLVIGNNTITDFLYLEDQENDGDTYDYSPLANSKVLKLHFNQANVTKTKHGLQQMELLGDAILAYDLEQPKKKKTGKLAYQLIITLDAQENITLKVKVNNQIKDHRLRLVVKTGINNNLAVSSVPYGFNKHVPQKEKNWQNKYSEKPVNVWPLDNNVSLSDESKTFTVYSTDVKEFEQDEQKLKFTLLATTSQLGKPNLLNRPGRASGDTTNVGHPLIPTPQAEYLGKHEYNFDIRIYKCFDSKKIANQSYLLKSSALAYQLQDLNLFANRLDNKLQDDLLPQTDLPKELSLFNEKTDLCVSACYPDYFDADAMIVRLFNPTKKKIAYRIPNNAEVVNACDQSQDYLGSVESFDLISLKIKK